MIESMPRALPSTSYSSPFFHLLLFGRSPWRVPPESDVAHEISWAEIVRIDAGRARRLVAERQVEQVAERGELGRVVPVTRGRVLRAVDVHDALVRVRRDCGRLAADRRERVEVEEVGVEAGARRDLELGRIRCAAAGFEDLGQLSATPASASVWAPPATSALMCEPGGRLEVADRVEVRVVQVESSSPTQMAPAMVWSEVPGPGSASSWTPGPGLMSTVTTGFEVSALAMPKAVPGAKVLSSPFPLACTPRKPTWPSSSTSPVTERSSRLISCSTGAVLTLTKKRSSRLGSPTDGVMSASSPVRMTPKVASQLTWPASSVVVADADACRPARCVTFAQLVAEVPRRSVLDSRPDGRRVEAALQPVRERLRRRVVGQAADAEVEARGHGQLLEELLSRLRAWDCGEGLGRLWAARIGVGRERDRDREGAGAVHLELGVLLRRGADGRIRSRRGRLLDLGGVRARPGGHARGQRVGGPGAAVDEGVVGEVGGRARRQVVGVAGLGAAADLGVGQPRA